MNKDELYLKIWREPALGVYYYEIANADGVVYIEEQNQILME